MNSTESQLETSFYLAFGSAGYRMRNLGNSMIEWFNFYISFISINHPTEKAINEKTFELNITMSCLKLSQGFRLYMENSQ